MTRLRSLRWLAALALFLGAAVGSFGLGCAAPTLPIPPPSALAEAPDADGLVRVTGNARPGVFVGCLNERSEAGVITRADADTGDYSLQIAAEVDDTLRVWQFEASSPGGEPRWVTVPAP